jgi:hypothetical protein
MTEPDAVTFMGCRAVVALSGALLAAGAGAAPAPAWIDSPVARLEALALIQTLNAEILSSTSATLTLEHWCRDHALADPAVIVAHRIDNAAEQPSAATRRDLQVSARQTVRYRRVQLMCGDHVLSFAENWYVPARLTAQMNRLLDTTQTPFGKAVQSLQPHREIISTQLLWLPLPKDWDLHVSPAGPETHPNGPLELPQALFETRAIVYTPTHRAVAEVNEVYQRDLLAFPEPQLPVP